METETAKAIMAIVKALGSSPVSAVIGGTDGAGNLIQNSVTVIANLIGPKPHIF